MQSPAKKLSIAVLGGRGMLGSDLVRFLDDRYIVHAIDRDNYEDCRGKEYDILINANGNSKRFWANEHIFEDFEASTISVYRSIFDFKFKKYIYISSSDVYNNHSSYIHTKEEQAIDAEILSPYGFHKYLSERIVQNNVKDYLILRSCMVLGMNLKKGPLYDIYNGSPLFISLDSWLQFITTGEIANIIMALIERGTRKQIFNVGGVGSFSLTDISRYVKEPVTVAKNAEKQEYEMDVSKLNGIYPLKTSEQYLEQFGNMYSSNLT